MINCADVVPFFLCVLVRMFFVCLCVSVCVLCLLFLFPVCNLCLAAMVGQDVHKRNCRIGRNCIGNVGLWRTCVEHGGILYMFLKSRLWCVKTTLIELLWHLCMCLVKEIMPECVLKLVRALSLSARHSIPWTQVVVKVGNIFFSASVIVCLHLSFSSSIQIYFPYFTCNTIVVWSSEYCVH